MELPALLSAVAMRVRHWPVCSAMSAWSAPTGPVPETWMWLPMRTAREKPMMGAKGEVPRMLVRLVMSGWMPCGFGLNQARLFSVLRSRRGGDIGSLRWEDLFRGQGKLIAQGCVFGFEGREFFADWGENLLQLLDGIARRDVLRTVPVEALDADENDCLYDFGLVGGAEGFDEGWGFLVVLMDFHSAQDLEAGLVGVVHEEEGYARVVFQISQADVLFVAAKIREADERWVDDANEAFGAAAMLHVGPAGLADGSHVEAVAALDEVLLG